MIDQDIPPPPLASVLPPPHTHILHTLHRYIRHKLIHSHNKEKMSRRRRKGRGRGGLKEECFAINRSSTGNWREREGEGDLWPWAADVIYNPRKQTKPCGILARESPIQKRGKKSQWYQVPQGLWCKNLSNLVVTKVPYSVVTGLICQVGERKQHRLASSCAQPALEGNTLKDPLWRWRHKHGEDR